MTTNGSALAAIEDVLRTHPDGATADAIASALPPPPPPKRTLQNRLRRLVAEGRVEKRGERRWTTYHLVAGVRPGPAEPFGIPLSEDAAVIRDRVRAPLAARIPVGYDRGFLEAYRPNLTRYLSAGEREHLAGVGRVDGAEQPAGTYARQIMGRLLIDLSWNSSRLEGNTYSLLDTRRLIEFGAAAEGRNLRDAQMILNHKDAIEFLVGEAALIGFDRHTVLNLHGILANNLLPDESAAGRLRRISVGIDGSVFHPLDVPQLVEECFDRVLATAAAIDDPFEQALFVMVQLPYLQPFDDVNKRVSRLAANIPFIRRNLCPLAFTDVPASDYTDAMLAVYELNRVEPLKEVFLWAYQRSAQRYAAIRQSLGEPDPFRLKHRDSLRTVVAGIIHGRMDRRAAARHIVGWTKDHIAASERDRFRDVAEREILGIHEGNFARYGIRPSEFEGWREIWNRRTA